MTEIERKLRALEAYVAPHDDMDDGVDDPSMTTYVSGDGYGDLLAHPHPHARHASPVAPPLSSVQAERNARHIVMLRQQQELLRLLATSTS